MDQRNLKTSHFWEQELQYRSAFSKEQWRNEANILQAASLETLKVSRDASIRTCGEGLVTQIIVCRRALLVCIVHSWCVSCTAGVCRAQQVCVVHSRCVSCTSGVCRALLVCVVHCWCVSLISEHTSTCLTSHTSPCPMSHTPCLMLRTTCLMLYSSRSMPQLLDVPCSLPHVPCPLPHVSCPMPHASVSMKANSEPVFIACRTVDSLLISCSWGHLVYRVIVCIARVCVGVSRCLWCVGRCVGVGVCECV